jgi:Fe2+ or Zn2+ uptake regulation protein
MPDRNVNERKQMENAVKTRLQSLHLDATQTRKRITNLVARTPHQPSALNFPHP